MPNKQNLTDFLIRNLKPHERGAYLVWDTKQRGLAVQVQPTGRTTYKCIYSFKGRPRWYHLADTQAIGLSDARKLAGRVMFAVAEGHDPQAERKASRSVGTFEEIAERYVAEYATKKNKSWKHTATKLVAPYLIPRWGKLQIGDITRSDVEAVHTALADRPQLANTNELLALLGNGVSEDDCLAYLQNVRAPQIKDWMKHQVRQISYELDGTTLH